MNTASMPDHEHLGMFMATEPSRLSGFSEDERIAGPNQQAFQSATNPSPESVPRAICGTDDSVDAQELLNQITQGVSVPDADLDESKTTQGFPPTNVAELDTANKPSRTRSIKLHTGKNRPAPSQSGQMAQENPPPKISKIRLTFNKSRSASMEAAELSKKRPLDPEESDAVEEPPKKRQNIILTHKNRSAGLKRATESSSTYEQNITGDPNHQKAFAETSVAVNMPYAPDSSANQFSDDADSLVASTPTFELEPSENESQTESPSSTEASERVHRKNAESSTASQEETPSSSAEPDNEQQASEETVDEKTNVAGTASTDPTPKKRATKQVKWSPATASGIAPNIEGTEAPSANTTATNPKKRRRQGEPSPSGETIRRSTRKRTVSERALEAMSQPPTPAVQSEAPGHGTNRSVPRRMAKEERQKQQQQKNNDRYTPSIDPLVQPKEDDCTPHELARMNYAADSIGYFERRFGEKFPVLTNTAGATLSSIRQSRNIQASTKFTEAQQAFANQEREWEEKGRLANSDPKRTISFKPAPKNTTQLKKWLGSHGKPLQREGYITEDLKMSAQVQQDKANREPYPGAKRVDEFGRLLEPLDEDFFADDVPDEEEIEHRRRIQSQPVNDTIEYEDRVDEQPYADFAQKPTAAMLRGDVSGVSVPSERWYFNEGAQRRRVEDSAEQADKEEKEVELAALGLMKLRMDHLKSTGMVAQYATPSE